MEAYVYNPQLTLITELSDAREMLVTLREFCANHPEFVQLVNVIDACLHLDYKRRITAQSVHEKFSKFLLQPP